ncbi:hypothetical protein CJU89_6094 [Yarrowia sp. B02]|nr:hypothetical protein CJU89_6094 [Yarrowia sp. B02]
MKFSTVLCAVLATTAVAIVPEGKLRNSVEQHKKRQASSALPEITVTVTTCKTREPQTAAPTAAAAPAQTSAAQNAPAQNAPAQAPEEASTPAQANGAVSHKVAIAVAALPVLAALL